MKQKHVILSILVPLAIVGLISVIAFIFCDAGLASNDCYEQYVPFFTAYYNIITGKQSMFYSLSGSMGYDFWAVFSYYLVSPLNFIILIFGKSNIVYAVNLLIVLKLAFCGGTFSVFLKNRFPDAKCKVIVLFSTIYALCGFMVGYAWNVMWLDGVILFPLVIMGLDVLMRDERPRWYWYTIFLALQVIISYFIGYMTCIFIFMYFFTYRFKSFKDFILKLLKVGGASLLGIGLGAIILIPAFGGLQSTYITGEQLPSIGLYGSFADTFGTIMLGNPPIGITFDRQYANLFMTVLVLLLAIVYILSGRIKVGNKLRNIFLIGILLFSMNFKPLNFIWHGMHEQTGIPNRFAFMVVFLMIIMAVEVCLQKRSAIKKHTMFIAWGVLTLGLAVIVFFNRDTLVYGIITSAMALAYVLIFNFCHSGKLRFNIINFFAYAELVVMFIISIFYANGTIIGDYSYYISDFDTINEEKEPGYYREKIDETYNPNEDRFENEMSEMTIEDITPAGLIEISEFMKNMGHQSIVNEATVYDINSLSLFNTFNNYAQTIFYCKTGATGGTNNVMYYGENALMDMLLGVKYYYTRYYNVYSSDYTYLKTVGNVDVYENNNALSVGYAIPDSLAEDDDLLYDNPFTTMNNICNDIVGENGYAIQSFDCTSDKDEIDGTKNYRYTAYTDGELLVKVAAADVHRIIFSVNNKELYTINRTGCVFDLGNINKGDVVDISIEYTEVKDSSCTIYAARMIDGVIDKVYKELADEQYEVKDCTDRYLTGTIDLKSDSKVMLTIPSTPGWSVYVDGVKTECDTFCDLFMVLDLSKGSHEITLNYMTPGFMYGAYVSGAALAIFIIALFISGIVEYNRQKKNQKATD